MAPEPINPEPQLAVNDYNEKNGSIDIDVKSESDVDEPVTDLFSSFPTPKGTIPEDNPLTVRAVVVGILLGSLVNASNVYLGKFSAPKEAGFLTNGCQQVSRLVSLSPPPCSVPSSVTESSSC